MATRQAKISFKDLEIKILVQKIVVILVIQAAIFWIFTIVDPGFIGSLIVYFWLVAIGSGVVVAWVHVHNIMEDVHTRKVGVLDQTDYAGK